MAQNRFDLRDALFESCEYLADVLARCSYVERNFWITKARAEAKIGDTLVKIYNIILQYAAEVLVGQNAGVGRWIMDSVTAVTKQRLAGLQSSIKENEQYLNQWVQFDQHLQHEKAAENILAGIDKISTDLQVLIQKFSLPIAEGALYDSYANQHEDMCLPDTRTELRGEISEWAESPDSQCIFWLNGMTGTGKSTIARTLAKSFKDKGQLGATFFFKKGESESHRNNAKRLISTITKQLIAFNRHLAPGVMSAIKEDPDIATISLREQFDALLLQPLLNLEVDHAATTVIVIDALDECDKEDDIRLLLLLLPEVQKATSLQLRFLLTSRPNLPIELGFKKIADTHQDLIIHEIPRPVVEHDITLYLEDQFSKIREDRSLPQEWPGDSVMKALVERTVPLFIAAATLCRFVQDEKWSPVKRLSALLADQTNYISKLGVTYLPVLNQLLAGQDESESQELIEEFKKIVVVIILLATPLSINALSQLLQLDADDVSNRLNPLRAVLHVPVDLNTPVGLLHLSFRDVLVDLKMKGKSPFWVDESEQHRQIFLDCLRVMQSSLRKNICNLPGESTTLEEIDQQTIVQSIPPELRYSCRYWTQHLLQSQDPTKDFGTVLSFLNKNYLQWVEVLSILGLVSETIEAISRLQTAYSDVQIPELTTFLYDAKRFILQNRQISDIAPLQIYCSGLIFAPLQSIVRKQNSHLMPDWISRLPEVDTRWSAEQHIIEGHDTILKSVTFSPEGLLLASADIYGRIKVWETATWSLQQTIAAHEDSIDFVAFSRDGRLLASISRAYEIGLWQRTTWVLQQTIQSHNKSIRSISFSLSGRLLTFGDEIESWDIEAGTSQKIHEDFASDLYFIALSPDERLLLSSSDGSGALSLWKTSTGKLQKTFKGNLERIDCVTFSPDEELLASGSIDCQIEIWEVTTGSLKHSLSSPKNVKFLAFSPDGKLLAAGFHYGLIKLWEVATGKLKQKLGRSGYLNSVVFSPDGKLLASGCHDQNVRIWEVSSSTPQESREGHSDKVFSLAFSPDGRLVASASHDRTIKLWETVTGVLQRTLEDHSDRFIPLTFVTFSPDGNLVASGSSNGIVKLWDTATGALQQKIDRHSNRVRSVTFSPDGQLVASASDDVILKLWDPATGALRQSLDDQNDLVRAMAFSPDGKILAWASEHETISLWEIETGALQQTPMKAGTVVSLMKFSPDGGLLAMASRKSIILWDMAKEEQEQEIRTRNQAAYLSFSRSSPYLETNVGRFEITISCDYISPADLPEPVPPEIEVLDNQWIALFGERVLWLPPDYRETGHSQCSLIRDSTLVLGHPSGRLSFFQFRR